MTLQEIKDEVAMESGLTTGWKELERQYHPLKVLTYVDEVAKRYATECCKASIEKAASAAEVTINGQPAIGGYQVERESIINDENIML